MVSPRVQRFYLGESGWGAFNFDGRVRVCTFLGVVELVARSGDGCAADWVAVDPPLPGRPDRELEEAVLERGMSGVHWSGPRLPKASKVLLLGAAAPGPLSVVGDDPVPVHIYRMLDEEAASAGKVTIGQTEPFGAGVVARLPELLPLPPPRRFNEMFGLLCRFAFRNGHANVSPDHREENQALGAWAQELKAQRRMAKATGGKVDDLPAGWVQSLEALRDWSWD